MTENVRKTEAQPVTAEPMQSDSRPAPRATRAPRYEIRESGERLTLLAEMPGVRAGDVEVTLENEVLRVRGRVAPATPEGLRLGHAEFEPADFEAAFGVREELDAERITASLRHGLLRVELPKRGPTQRSIPVTAG